MILEKYDPSVSELVSDILCGIAADSGIDIGDDGPLDFAEMDRLEGMIRERHPDWHYTRRELNGGQQICFLARNGRVMEAGSAVIHSFSYGHERGLIEFWDGKGDPVMVDAEEALALFEKALRGTKNASSFVRENMKTLMNSAKIPEGLQQKILDIEGLGCEENASEEET